jgi:hypothetical protein
MEVLPENAKTDVTEIFLAYPIRKIIWCLRASALQWKFFRQKSDPWIQFGYSTEVEALFLIKNSPAPGVQTFKVCNEYRET